MEKRTNIWFGLAILGIAIFVIIISLSFPPFMCGNKKLPGPNFFPIILSTILIILGSYEILISWREINVKKSIKSFAKYIKDWGNQNILIIIFSLIIYIYCLKSLGFALATFVFSLILMIRLKTGWIRGTIFSVIVVVVVVLLFEELFKVQLPEGFLGITFWR